MLRSANRRTAAALTSVLLLAGCTAAPQTLDVTTGMTPNLDAVALPGSLESQVDAAVAALPGIAQRALNQSGVPGMAIAVVHGDEVIFTGAYGVREIGTALAVTPETVFQIASLSKPLSATGVAAAIGQSGGTLDWTSNVHEFLPGFAYSDPMVTAEATIGDAFSHRTGFATGAGDDLEDLGFDRETILERLRLQPLDAFRSSYHYSNFGLTIGAEAVAASRGQQWEDLMAELVYAPIGMSSTSSLHADFLAHEDRALLHALENGAFVPLYDRDPDPQSPAGGVSSNVLDLAQWLRVLLADGSLDGTQLIDADALATAMTAQTVSGHGPGIEGRPAHYGFGFNAAPQVSGRMSISHSGAFALGAATNFQVVPELDLGIVVLTNGAPVGLPEAVTAEFLDYVQFGHATRDWVTDAAGFFAGYTAPSGDLVDVARPSSPAAPPALASLAGVYENPYFGELTIEAAGDKLIARLGPNGQTSLELQPWDGPVFVYAPLSESAPWGSRSSATFSADGSSLRLESFDAQHLGTWERR